MIFFFSLFIDLLYSTLLSSSDILLSAVQIYFSILA